MYEKGLLNKGDKIVLVAFGGGLTYAASLIEW
jgi:3-oxoacyl-[acyl-carrier-protein] synthase-3